MHVYRAIIFAFIVFAAISFIDDTAYSADPPLSNQPNPDVFPCCAGLGPAYAELFNSTTVRWNYNKNNLCAGSLLNETIEALDRLSQLTGWLVQYDSSAPMMIYLNCGTNWAAVSGGGTGVAACLCRGYPYNVTIDVNDVVTTYFRDTRVSILLHEIMHAILLWNEQYCYISGRNYTGCSYSNIIANTGWHDFMNTGPDSRHYFEYIEIQRIARLIDPCYSFGCVAGVGSNGGGQFVGFSVPPLASRVAMTAYRPADGSYRWTGKYIAVNHAVTAQGWHVSNWQLEAGEMACINRENGANIKLGRNDQCFSETLQ